MNVAKIMSKSLVTVQVNDSLRTIKKIFDSGHFHHLLVVEEVGDEAEKEACKPEADLPHKPRFTPKLPEILTSFVDPPVSGKLIGVISDRDLFKALSPNIGTDAETRRDIATLKKKAHQIMTKNPVTLTTSAGIYDAVRIFNRHSISCIPVVDENSSPVGIISWRDILRVLENNRKQKNPE